MELEVKISNKKANLHLGMFNNNTGDYRIVKNQQKSKN